MPPTRWPSRRAGAGRRGADVETQECRRGEIDDLPAIDVGGEFARLHEGGRRRRIDDPAGDGDVVLRALHLDLRLVDQRRVADRGLVHERQMGEIEQVVDHELPVALDVKVLALRAPVRIVQPMVVGDLVGIGERGVAHPDPQPVIALDHRIASHPRRARDQVLARHPHAGAGLVVTEAMIVALQRIADQLAHRERQMTVRAPVLERDRRAVLEAIEHDRLAENDPAERLALDLGDRWRRRTSSS